MVAHPDKTVTRAQRVSPELREISSTFLAGSVLAVDLGPLAPSPLGAHVGRHAVRRGIALAAGPLHPGQDLQWLMVYKENHIYFINEENSSGSSNIAIKHL